MKRVNNGLNSALNQLISNLPPGNCGIGEKPVMSGLNYNFLGGIKA